MKLLIVFLFTAFSLPAIAQWRLPNFGSSSTGGLRAVWSCDTKNRGNMPKEKEVEIYYDEDGTMNFRPDIFKLGFNPLNALGSLIGKKKQSSDVDQCLRAFLNTIPQAITAYQSTQCEGLAIQTCLREPSEIIRDTRQTVKRSKFYSKYKDDLSSVIELNEPSSTISDNSQSGPEVITEPKQDLTLKTNLEVKPESNLGKVPDPDVSSLPEFEPTVYDTPVLPKPDADLDKARTDLLDYLVDNAPKIENLKEFAKHCPNLGETTGPNAKYCSETMQYNSDFLTNVSQMFTAVRGSPASVLRVVQSLECVPPSLSEFSDIEGILRRLDSREDCESLPNVGDFKLFKKHPVPPAWYTTGNYLLKKTGDNNYEATLTLDFKDNGGSVSPEQMMAQVNSCLGNVNPFLRGPGGKKISLRALSPKEASEQIPAGERPSVEPIRIQPDGTQIDAQNITGKADCATITHELLHHLGLCDEYKEGRTNIVAPMVRSRAEEWSCRNVTSRPSIMKNHQEAFNMTIPRKLTCECTDDICKKTLVSSDPAAVAQRKVLLVASPGAILGQLRDSCKFTPLVTTAKIPEPDKAYTDVSISGGVLKFQHRSIFPSQKAFLTARSNVVCTCPADDDRCPASLARAAQYISQNQQTENCPQMTMAKGEFKVADPGEVTSSNSNSFNIVTIPRAESLLTPNQFDKILTGSCMTSSSSLFKQCSEYAYVPGDSAACANKPSECKDDDKFTGVTEQ